MNDDYFDAKAYAIRVIKAKGYDPAKAADVADVFALQWPFWKELIQKHRLGDDEKRAEHLLTSFATKTVIGGVAKILETFAAHLDAQPKQGGSPDWTQAGREWAECCFCDGRGVVSEIPCRIVRRGEVIERAYSFACVCDGGKRFAGMKIAEDWMLNFARDRKQAEIASVPTTLERYGIDPNADPQTRARQFHAAFTRMKQDVASRKATAKNVRPSVPRSVEEARAAMSLVRATKTKPAEKIDPERMALAAFTNGDERNEWE